MKTVPAAEFKTHCLALLKEVAEHHETVIVTKHGRPVARILPYITDATHNPLKDSIVFETDLISPIDETWDVEA
ncbi:MAG: type II toxin-antitoxin system Phd/YefM family antitoxin [Candidatus Tectomicrobia bacterium]|nr:type II toxin-antitoxin system Phd/YefM family antitoxin [Candidatus Tectomicrobia bacterium]